MKKEWIEQLETPCLVIDMEKTKRNIQNTQKAADENHCKLRPHIKTHKNAAICKDAGGGRC